MSLIKEITTVNGITLVYHRIAALTKNKSNVTICVQSYTSETTRDLEIELVTLQSTANDELIELSVLTSKAEGSLTSTEAARIAAITANAERRAYLINAYNESGGFHVRSKDYAISDVVSDVNFAQAYAILKTFDDFKDAVDA